jgi:multidrug efflux system outer membrane protein
MDQQLAATQQRQAAAADVAMLEEARYREGIDSYLNFLDAQRSYYAVQQVLVQTKLTAAQNRVALYSSLGGDALLQTAPVCDVVYVSNASNAKLASQCSPI